MSEETPVSHFLPQSLHFAHSLEKAALTDDEISDQKNGIERSSTLIARGARVHAMTHTAEEEDPDPSDEDLERARDSATRNIAWGLDHPELMPPEWTDSISTTAKRKIARDVDTDVCGHCGEPITMVEGSMGAYWTHKHEYGESQQCQDGSFEYAEPADEIEDTSNWPTLGTTAKRKIAGLKTASDDRNLAQIPDDELYRLCHGNWEGPTYTVYSPVDEITWSVHAESPKRAIDLLWEYDNRFNPQSKWQSKRNYWVAD